MIAQQTREKGNVTYTKHQLTISLPQKGKLHDKYRMVTNMLELGNSENVLPLLFNETNSTKLGAIIAEIKQSFGNELSVELAKTITNPNETLLVTISVTDFYDLVTYGNLAPKELASKISKLLYEKFNLICEYTVEEYTVVEKSNSEMNNYNRENLLESVKLNFLKNYSAMSVLTNNLTLSTTDIQQLKLDLQTAYECSPNYDEKTRIAVNYFFCEYCNDYEIDVGIVPSDK